MSSAKRSLEGRQENVVPTKPERHAKKGIEKARAMWRSVAMWAVLGVFVALSGSVRAETEDRCERIVSLAPSVTEVLFELGLGSHVIGVSRYDRYPAAVRDLPQVGGLFDPNYEVIVRLRPTLVVALAEFGEKIGYTERLGIPVAVVDHRSIEGILTSFQSLGERCRVEARATAIVGELRDAMKRVADRGVKRAPVPTMIVVGGGSEGRVLKSVYVSGRDGFYDDLLRLAGGENVVRGNTMAVPTVSAEGLLALDPEVIIQVRDEEESRGASAEEVATAWRALPQLRAVRDGRVFIVSDDYATIPGPRFIKTLERFASILGAKEGRAEP